MRILIVEDDRWMAGALKRGLERAGFTADDVRSGEEAEACTRHEAFDLAVVDLGLPGMDGLELIRRWRRAGDSRPVLILTARDALSDRVDALELGGDDFMAKPFELPELIARVRALIRRSKAVASSQLTCGPLEMDLGCRSARLNGQLLELRRREWEILECLLLSSPKMVTKDTLVQILTGWGSELTNNAVEVYVSRLRAKLQSGGIEIRTIRGIGYRLDAPEP
jgi:two-component system, OmpR family, response regulator